jgi:hypothetical protein
LRFPWDVSNMGLSGRITENNPSNEEVTELGFSNFSLATTSRRLDLEFSGNVPHHWLALPDCALRLLPLS